MLTQRISISAVCGYSSLSIMFLSKDSVSSRTASGSIHVVTKVARFIRAFPSSISSSWIVSYATLADELRHHLQATSAEIDVVHIHRAQSRAVQSIVATLLREHLEFREEVVLTPSDGFITHARPDFYYSLAPGRGIIAEVERGGTTTNNHDLKDLWKTHIAPDAQHLFLVVPNAAGTRPAPPANTRTPAS